MKLQYIYTSIFIVLFTIISSCEDRLNIYQNGVSNFDNFYKTDTDAEEAIIACYSKWKDTFLPSFWIKNLLSDDCYAAGESWTAANADRLANYTFDSDFSHIKSLYENLYKVIYSANIVLTYVAEDSEIKSRARAEAKVFRAMSYIELITLWGTPAYVDHPLSPTEYAQSNGNKEMLWQLVENDLIEAIQSNQLTEKSNLNDQTYRITKQFAQALLGKSYIYQSKWNEAVIILEEVINSEKYDLFDDFGSLLTTKAENNCESLFESNYVYDANNATTTMSNMIWVYINWRGDMLSFDASQTQYSSNGWGFFNPTESAYKAFVDMGDNYRLNNSIGMIYYSIVE